ncbi:hypothetical protein D3C74_447470 [compost metagenome]
MTMAIPCFDAVLLYGEALLLTVPDDLADILFGDPCPFWGSMDNTLQILQQTGAVLRIKEQSILCRCMPEQLGHKFAERNLSGMI